MNNQTEEIIFHILECLPDKNHQTHRLLFCSLLKISQDRPKETVRAILTKFESIPKPKHEGVLKFFFAFFVVNKWQNLNKFSHFRTFHRTSSKRRKLHFAWSIRRAYRSGL